MAEGKRGKCRTCGREGSITADGVLRHHQGTKPEHFASPDSKRCKGAGELPEEERCENCGHAGHGHADYMHGQQLDLSVLKPCGGESGTGGPPCPCDEELREMNGSLPETVTGYVCRIPAGPDGCGRPVQLTANSRARSHLNNAGHPCGGGSAWPLAVDKTGRRTDTTPECLCASGSPDNYEGPSRNCPQHGDGRTPQQQAEMDRRRADPVGTALERLMNDAVDDPGTVLDSLEARARSITLPPAEREALAATETPAEKTSRLTREVCEVLRNRSPEEKLATARRMDERASAALGLPLDPDLFDPTHVFTDSSGTEWVHPGMAVDCDLPECCTHPDGWVYGDDGKGHSGDVCRVCGGKRPEPVPSPDDWHAPADILARMPEDVRRLAGDNPECWDCRHEVTPLADRFEPDGSVKEVMWTCRADCMHNGDHYGSPCRPQHSTQARVGDLDEGVLFVRHTVKAPLNRLVYRAGTPSMGPLSATVVSIGPYAGRTGSLTNMDEEITCTDLNGTPRPRRDPGTGATSPSSPARRQPSTFSPPAPTTPAPSRGPGSTPRTTASAPAAARTTSKKATGSGPTAPAGSSTRTAQMSDAFSTPKEAVKQSDKYDSYGRYKLAHPDTGKPVKWTRATTFAKSVQDTFALSMWAQRMTLKGATLRSDIVAAAGRLDVKDDKDRMNALVDDAKKAAGDKIAANKGTAVHGYAEDYDNALLEGPEAVAAVLERVPDEFRPQIDAYAAILADFGLEPVSGLIEFSTAVKQYEICGTGDRVYRVTRDITLKLNGRTVTLYAGEYVIGDLKTGADLSYGWQEIAIQLAIYSQGLNTSGVWDWSTRTWGRPSYPDDGGEVQIKVRTDVAIVPHLPVDRSRTGAPAASLYVVDIDAGWAAAVLCASVRNWRKERKLATLLSVADVSDPHDTDPDTDVPSAVLAHPVTAARPATLEEKAQSVTSRAEASDVWKEATAARVTQERLKELTAIMQKKLTSFVEKGA